MKYIVAIFGIIAIISTDVLSDDQQVPIVRQSQDVNFDGSYQYSYETGNGISAQESGTGGVSAQGGAKWTSPEGETVEFQYVADENGYQATGSHIPTPPPIPPLIARALEWIMAHPEPENQQ